MVIEIDLEHRRRTARPEAFDLAQAKASVRRDLSRLDAELFFQMRPDVLGAAQVATDRPAKLDVVLADFLGEEHRKGRWR